MGGEPSLVEDLRRRGAPGVALLLRTRPDLANPAPASLTELVSRSQEAASVTAALASLDAAQLRVLVGIAAEADADQLPQMAGDVLPTLVDALTDRCLVSGDPPRCTPVVRRLLGPHPAGLAPASTRPLTDALVTAGLAQLTDGDREVLDRLAWGPPYGSVADAERAVDLPTAASPIDRLLALGLLQPVDRATVVLPREVALVLRGGQVFDLVDGRPELPIFGTPETSAPTPADAAISAEVLAAWLLGELSAGGGRAVLEAAADDDHWVRLAYANDDGTLGLAVVRVLFVGHGSAFLVRRAGRRLSVPLARVVAAEVAEPVIINDLPLPGGES